MGKLYLNTTRPLTLLVILVIFLAIPYVLSKENPKYVGKSAERNLVSVKKRSLPAESSDKKVVLLQRKRRSESRVARKLRQDLLGQLRYRKKREIRNAARMEPSKAWRTPRQKREITKSEPKALVRNRRDEGYTPPHESYSDDGPLYGGSNSGSDYKPPPPKYDNSAISPAPPPVDYIHDTPNNAPYAPPLSLYESVPTSSYTAPSSAYPTSSYSAPASTYPTSSYSAPASNYPTSSYSAPASTYPTSSYSPPDYPTSYAPSPVSYTPPTTVNYQLPQATVYTPPVQQVSDYVSRNSYSVPTSYAPPSPSYSQSQPVAGYSPPTPSYISTPTVYPAAVAPTIYPVAVPTVAGYPQGGYGNDDYDDEGLVYLLKEALLGGGEAGLASLLLGHGGYGGGGYGGGEYGEGYDYNAGYDASLISILAAILVGTYDQEGLVFFIMDKLRNDAPGPGAQRSSSAQRVSSLPLDDVTASFPPAAGLSGLTSALSVTSALPGAAGMTSSLPLASALPVGNAASLTSALPLGSAASALNTASHVKSVQPAQNDVIAMDVLNQAQPAASLPTAAVVTSDSAAKSAQVQLPSSGVAINNAPGTVASKPAKAASSKQEQINKLMEAVKAAQDAKTASAGRSHY